MRNDYTDDDISDDSEEEEVEEEEEEEDVFSESESEESPQRTTSMDVTYGVMNSNGLVRPVSLNPMQLSGILQSSRELDALKSLR